MFAFGNTIFLRKCRKLGKTFKNLTLWWFINFPIIFCVPCTVSLFENLIWLSSKGKRSFVKKGKKIA